MWKSSVIGAAALALVGTSLVYAQQQSGNGPNGPGYGHHWSAEDRGAFLDARIAALRAGLKLTADQEKNWQAFEQAYRDFAKVRGEQRRAFREREGDQRSSVNPVERMQRRAEAASARGAALKRLADASGPLYQSLDEAQKGRFQLLLRATRPHHHEHFAFSRDHQFRGQGEER